MADQSKSFQIARRYTNAIFELLNENERTTFSKECDDFLQACAGTSEIYEFIKNPLIGSEEKATVLKKVFPESSKIQNVSNFFELLCQKKRDNILPAFCETFQQRVFEEQGKALCILTTARPVGEAVVNSIQQRISDHVKKELVVKTKVDPSLLGGFKAEVGGTVLDGSVVSQLKGLRTNIMSAVKR